MPKFANQTLMRTTWESMFFKEIILAKKWDKKQNKNKGFKGV